ncbi:transcriptional regulator [Flammeovirga pectinis]|uniref:Transcriptional regulator n=1 Tax=Flammeovirga pectinis TaxID=2494373 RepID=A0A3S9P6R8_9BACT|nr:metalloregulator ArsR/SmtB family transcription factor [Flammeovirga pectinis]AZQ63888.1 transcriptional regulator [Flammeovirga pectinis]
MGITKIEGFDPTITNMAEILKALGHPARLSIIKYLANKKECVNSVLVDELPLAQSTISRHLSELKKVGLIKGTIVGNSVNYCIDESIWQEVNTYFQDILTGLQNNNCC